MSYQLDSLAGSSSKTETTGSIATVTNAKAGLGKEAPAMPPERDLVFTRAAVSEALARGGKDVSLPWENPESGARGTVTPIASAYAQDGAVCQDFLASYVGTRGESWLRGEACRDPNAGQTGKQAGKQAGKWQVRSLKPWTRS